MLGSCYGLSFNPFDKQNAREKDRFLSKDISEMTSRLDYLVVVKLFCNICG